MRLLVLACVLLLTGCAGDPAPTPSSGVSAERLLANGFWRVSGADEPASTRVRFGTVSVDVFRAKGDTFGTLATRGDHLLASINGWSMSLGDDFHVPWLEAAATVEPEGDAVRLLDVHGDPVATLTRADAPPPSKQYETDPTPPVEPSHAPIVPGADAGGTAAGLIGVWGLARRNDVALTLREDGSWSTKTSCDSGTGAPQDAAAGRWRLLAGSALLVTSGASALVGCFTAQTPTPSDARAIGDFWEAGSVGIDGDRLTVYARSGTALGTLVRR